MPVILALRRWRREIKCLRPAWHSEILSLKTKKLISQTKASNQPPNEKMNKKKKKKREKRP
jgi:hypothetical protein